MSTTAAEIIALAQSTKALSTAQLQKILELAPKMGEADLENLKRMIVAVQEEHRQALEKEVSSWEDIGAKVKGLRTKKAAQNRAAEEALSRSEESTHATQLINSI